MAGMAEEARSIRDLINEATGREEEGEREGEAQMIRGQRRSM